MAWLEQAIKIMVACFVILATGAFCRPHKDREKTAFTDITSSSVDAGTDRERRADSCVDSSMCNLGEYCQREHGCHSCEFACDPKRGTQSRCELEENCRDWLQKPTTIVSTRIAITVGTTSSMTNINTEVQAIDANTHGAVWIVIISTVLPIAAIVLAIVASVLCYFYCCRKEQRDRPRCKHPQQPSDSGEAADGTGEDSTAPLNHDVDIQRSRGQRWATLRTWVGQVLRVQLRQEPQDP